MNNVIRLVIVLAITVVMQLFQFDANAAPLCVRCSSGEVYTCNQAVCEENLDPGDCMRYNTSNLDAIRLDVSSEGSGEPQNVLVLVAGPENDYIGPPPPTPGCTGLYRVESDAENLNSYAIVNVSPKLEAQVENEGEAPVTVKITELNP